MYKVMAPQCTKRKSPFRFWVGFSFSHVPQSDELVMSVTVCVVRLAIAPPLFECFPRDK